MRVLLEVEDGRIQYVFADEEVEVLVRDLATGSLEQSKPVYQNKWYVDVMFRRFEEFKGSRFFSLPSWWRIS